MKKIISIIFIAIFLSISIYQQLIQTQALEINNTRFLSKKNINKLQIQLGLHYNIEEKIVFNTTIIDLQGYGENLRFIENGDSLFAYQNGELVAKAKKDNRLNILLNSYKSSTSNTTDWTYFGPDKSVFTWKQSASAIVIAGIISFGIGAGANAILTIIGIVSGVAGISVGGYTLTSGKYRLVNGRPQGSYKSDIYVPRDGYLGTYSWSGSR